MVTWTQETDETRTEQSKPTGTDWATQVYELLFEEMVHLKMQRSEMMETTHPMMDAQTAKLTGDMDELALHLSALSHEVMD